MCGAVLGEKVSLKEVVRELLTRALENIARPKALMAAEESSKTVA
jgi:hypothetical protein